MLCRSQLTSGLHVTTGANLTGRLATYKYIKAAIPIAFAKYEKAKFGYVLYIHVFFFEAFFTALL